MRHHATTHADRLTTPHPATANTRHAGATTTAHPTRARRGPGRAVGGAAADGVVDLAPYHDAGYAVPAGATVTAPDNDSPALAAGPDNNNSAAPVAVVRADEAASSTEGPLASASATPTTSALTAPRPEAARGELTATKPRSVLRSRRARRLAAAAVAVAAAGALVKGLGVVAVAQTPLTSAPAPDVQLTPQQAAMADALTPASSVVPHVTVGPVSADDPSASAGFGGPALSSTTPNAGSESTTTASDPDRTTGDAAGVSGEPTMSQRSFALLVAAMTRAGYTITTPERITTHPTGHDLVLELPADADTLTAAVPVLTEYRATATLPDGSAVGFELPTDDFPAVDQPHQARPVTVEVTAYSTPETLLTTLASVAPTPRADGHLAWVGGTDARCRSILGGVEIIARHSSDTAATETAAAHSGGERVEATRTASDSAQIAAGRASTGNGSAVHDPALCLLAPESAERIFTSPVAKQWAAEAAAAPNNGGAATTAQSAAVNTARAQTVSTAGDAHAVAPGYELVATVQPTAGAAVVVVRAGDTSSGRTEVRVTPTADGNRLDVARPNAAGGPQVLASTSVPGTDALELRVTVQNNRVTASANGQALPAQELPAHTGINPAPALGTVAAVGQAQATFTDLAVKPLP